MRPRRHLGDVAQQLRVHRAVVEVVVADQYAERLAAELAVFLLVHFLEDRALVPGSAAELLERAAQLLLGDVEDLDLQELVGFGVVDQVGQPAPRRLQLLEVLVVHDLVDLAGQLGVDRRDHRLDRTQRVVGDQAGAGERLARQRLDRLLHRFARPVAFGLELAIHEGRKIAGGRGFRQAGRGDGRKIGFGHAQDSPPVPVTGLGAAARLAISAGSCSSLPTSSSAPVLPSM